MITLTEARIRASFVNATKREIAHATLPDLTKLRWDSIEFLGWRDVKLPLVGYVVAEIDGEPVGIRLTTEKSARRGKAMCAWCEDVVAVDDVSLYAARRAGAAGRRGGTVGTLICTTFDCSRNVRRPPTFEEVGNDPAMREHFTQSRIAGLRERSERFVREVLRTR